MEDKIQQLTRNIFIYCRLLLVNLKTMVGFRVDFLLIVLSGSLTQILGIVFVFTLFNNVPSIDGWTLYEIAFMYSLVYIVDGLVSIFFDGTWNLTSIINSGEFDRILLRPINPVIQIVTLDFGTQGIGNILIGSLLMFYSLGHLETRSIAFNVFLIFFFIIVGVFIRVSINLCIALCSFWTKNGNPLMMANYSLSEYSKYPLSVYSWPIQLLVLIIPYAFISYVPASFILMKDATTMYYYPLIIIYCIFSVRFIMKRSLNKYESVGN